MPPAPPEACAVAGAAINTTQAVALSALLLVAHAVSFAPLWAAPVVERGLHTGDADEAADTRRQFVRWDDAELYEQATFWRGLRRPHVHAAFTSTLYETPMTISTPTPTYRRLLRHPTQFAQAEASRASTPAGMLQCCCRGQGGCHIRDGRLEMLFVLVSHSRSSPRRVCARRPRARVLGFGRWLTRQDAAAMGHSGAVYEPLGWLLKGVTWVAAGGVLSPAAIVAVSSILHTAATALLLLCLLTLIPRIHRLYLPRALVCPLPPPPPLEWASLVHTEAPPERDPSGRCRCSTPHRHAAHRPQRRRACV